MTYARYHYNKTRRIAGHTLAEAWLNAINAVTFQVAHEQRK